MSEQRTVHQIARQRASEFLWGETQGRIFSCYFRKKDGTMREMTCRRGVKVGLVGTGLAYDPKPRGLLPVFDMNANGRRMVNINTLVSFNVSGETFILA